MAEWNRDQINNWYNQYLGHDVGEGWQSWSGHDDAESAIKNSAEAQAYRQRSAPTPPPPPPPGAPTWGNQGGTPQSDPWQNYYNQPQPALPPSGPAVNTAADPVSAFHDWQLSKQTISPDELASVLANNPAFAGIKMKPGSKDVVILPSGEEVDVIGDVGGQNTSAWIDAANRAIMARGGGGGGSTGAGGGGGGSFSTSSSVSGPVLGSQYQSLIDLLMNRAKGSLDVDPLTDKIIRPQVDAAAAQNERQKREYLSGLAERGGLYTNLQGEERLANERAGQQNVALQSQLVNSELQARRGEIQNALSELGSLLSANQQMSLQRQLAEIDAALRQQQINSGNDQFMASLGLQAENQNNYWDAIRSGRLG